MKQVLTVILSVLLLAGISAYADNANKNNNSNLRVGILNLRAILQESTEMQAINKDLKDKYSPRETELQTAQKQLQEDTAKLHRDQAVMGTAELEGLEKKILTGQQELQDKAESFKQDVLAAQNDAVKKFLEKVEKVVNDIAVKEKYDLILQGDSVVYATGKFDLTKKVLDILNKDTDSTKKAT